MQVDRSGSRARTRPDRTALPARSGQSSHLKRRWTSASPASAGLGFPTQRDPRCVYTAPCFPAIAPSGCGSPDAAGYFLPHECPTNQDNFLSHNLRKAGRLPGWESCILCAVYPRFPFQVVHSFHYVTICVHIHPPFLLTFSSNRRFVYKAILCCTGRFGPFPCYMV